MKKPSNEKRYEITAPAEQDNLIIDYFHELSKRWEPFNKYIWFVVAEYKTYNNMDRVVEITIDIVNFTRTERRILKQNFKTQFPQTRMVLSNY